MVNIVWIVSKYGVVSGPYFPVLGLNTGKYGPEITPYLDTFHAAQLFKKYLKLYVMGKTVNLRSVSFQIYA